MPLNSYNRLAGRSVDRLSALSDGIFAFAMTLLVLDLGLPALDGIHSEGDFWRALSPLAPRLITWGMSFLTLGLFWNGQQAQLNLYERSDRDLSWIQLAFLAAVSLVPFSTRLLARCIDVHSALFLYWLNILALGAILYGALLYAERTGLLNAEATPQIRAAVKRRVFVAQSLYAVGMLLSAFGNYWGIGFIVLVQLNFAVGGLRHRWLSKL